MSIERKTLPEQHYLYVDRAASLTAPAEIGEAMASGFGEVFGFVARKGVTPLAMPMSLYIEMPSGAQMAFRAGVLVSADDAKKAEGEVKAATIPAGDVFTTTHVGPYASLNQTHKALWDHMSAQGAAKAMPVWEIYVDDPQKTPEQSLRTEIYRAIGA
jgi:effector-binding domain-containing protein